MKIDLTKLGTLANTFLLMVTVIGGGYGGYVWIQNNGMKTQDIEQRIFENPKQKFEVTQHTEEFDKTQKEIYKRERHLDSVVTIFNTGLITLDTIIKVINDRERRNAITNYQSKKNTDSILSLWKGYNENVKDE